MTAPIILFPGQGAQSKGMGAELFSHYPQLTKQASDILGYDLVELCLENPDGNLNQTQYTQPALYVVNALSYKKRNDTTKLSPKVALGHSLGEYNALLAAGVFDFETGLKLVQKRGALMAKASGGAMTAIIGLSPEKVEKILKKNGLEKIEAANYNTPTQLVISGSKDEMTQAIKVLEKEAKAAIPLPVSAAFHSSYMKEAQVIFSEFLQEVNFSPLAFPVIANYTARPYAEDKLKETLSKQISNPVKWTESIRYLMGQGASEYTEINSNILTNMVNDIKQNAEPLIVKEQKIEKASTTSTKVEAKNVPPLKPIKDASSFTMEALGNSGFREKYNIRYAYLAGGMYRGIASKELVIKMAKAQLMSYLGTGGMSLNEIEKDLDAIVKALPKKAPYGMNLLCNLMNPQMEMDTIQLYLKHGVRFIEASAYMQMTPALVWYRLSGLTKDAQGNIERKHHVLGKCSRPEIATLFMSPAPENIVKKLLEEGHITDEQAELAKDVPMAEDICIEADSGGHTDMGISTVLLPAMMHLRQELSEKHNYIMPIYMGLAGGIGTPEAALAAFVMGADFILTGSINQCTVEAGNSDMAKDLLQEINVQDTEYAPAGDMFEIGAKVQVLKRGVFFPARANKLYQLYTHYNGLDEIPEKTKKQIQERYFKKSFEDVWNETKAYFESKNMQNEIDKALKNPKHKMALVFRWYFSYSGHVAFTGDESNKVDSQIHVGPALGAFNQWVKGTEMENWRKRHVDEIAQKIMNETLSLAQNRFQLMLKVTA